MTRPGRRNARWPDGVQAMLPTAARSTGCPTGCNSAVVLPLVKLAAVGSAFLENRICHPLAISLIHPPIAGLVAVIDIDPPTHRFTHPVSVSQKYCPPVSASQKYCPPIDSPTHLPTGFSLPEVLPTRCFTHTCGHRLQSPRSIAHPSIHPHICPPASVSQKYSYRFRYSVFPPPEPINGLPITREGGLG